MKIEEKMPWSVCMVERQLEDLEVRMMNLSGCREELTAPMVEIGAILRPSLIGSTKGTVKTPAAVTIDHYQATTNVIGIEFPDSTAAFVGRPVFGHSGDIEFISTFGDDDSVESGFKRIEAVTSLIGESVVVGYKLDGGPKILSGLTYEEVTGFIVGCLSAVEKHRSRNKKRN